MAKSPVLEEGSPITIDGLSGAEVGDSLPDELALDNLLAELGDDAGTVKVSVWRVDETITGRGAGKDVFLCKMSPVDFEAFGLAGIQQEWGAGKYRVRIFGDGRLIQNRIFVVGPPSKLIEPIKPANGTATPQHSDFAQGLAALANAMQGGFQSLAQILVQQSGNRKSMLEELTLYKSLFAPTGPASGGVDPLQAISTAVSLIKDLGGNNGGKETSTADIFLKLAEEFAPAITEIAKGQALKNAQAAAPKPAPVSLPNPGAPLPAPKQPETTMLDPVAMGLKAYLPMFIQQAQAGNDPQKYADMILDNVDIEQAERLANRPDWLEYLTSINAGVAANAQWFASLRTHLLRFIAEEKAAEFKPDRDLTPKGEAGFNTLGTEPD